MVSSVFAFMNSIRRRRDEPRDRPIPLLRVVSVVCHSPCLSIGALCLSMNSKLGFFESIPSKFVQVSGNFKFFCMCSHSFCTVKQSARTEGMTTQFAIFMKLTNLEYFGHFDSVNCVHFLC